MNWNKMGIFIWLCLLLSLCSAAYAQDEKAKVLDAKEVHQLLNNPQVVLIDVRKPEEFQKGHLEGAINLWRPDFTDQNRELPGFMAGKDQMEALLSRHGLQPSQEFLLYDNKALCDAARLWWVLHYYGHRRVSFLNGGLAAWKDADYDLSTGISKVSPSSYRFPEKPNEEYFIGKDEMVKAVEEGKAVIIDTRTIEEVTGERQKEGASRAGRIPGAQWFDWSFAVNYKGDKLIRSEKRLRHHFDSLGATSDKDIIVYCHSGARSAHTTMVLTQLLGYEKVRNYDGSWIEWSADTSLAIASGPIFFTFWEKVVMAYSAYAGWVWYEITHPSFKNYFYWLFFISLFFFAMEIWFPWRKGQARFRKDFWLDFFYMYFNFFIFNLIIYHAASGVVVEWFMDFLLLFGIKNLVAIEVQTWPIWGHLLLGFFVRDFVQWWIHRLLHRVPWLWQFHKVHHSVEQMGFAAHLRYHWMENVVYRTLEYIPLAFIGVGLGDFFIIHIFTLAVGHWNHANINPPLGPLKYIFNHPQMHIWHHARTLPDDHRYGVNFGLTLSIWDWLFRTAYIPSNGRDIKLGFPRLEQFPKDFWRQSLYGFFIKDKGDASERQN